MPNTETDKLGLVDTTTVQNGLWIFGRRVNENVGFCLELFTPSGQYRGEVNSMGEGVRAQNGDTVLRVNLGSFLLTFDGNLTTSDHLVRRYHARLMLRVSNPYAFALSYRQGNDPVALARNTIDADLTGWARLIEHDRIDAAALGTRATRVVATLHNLVGLTAVQVLDVTADLAPTRGKIVDIIEDDKVNQVQGGIARRNDFIVQDHRQMLDFREKTLEEQFRFASEEYRKLRSQGYTDAEILRDRPDIMEIRGGMSGFQGMSFNPMLAPVNPVSGSALPMGNTLSALPPGVGVYDTSTTTPGTGQEDLGRVGIWVWTNPVELSVTQLNAVQQRRLLINQTFQISKVNAGGPAQDVGLRMGDIILLVNGVELSDISLLRTFLTTNTGMHMSTTITVLRDDQILDTTIQL